MAVYTNQILVYVDGRNQKITSADSLVISGSFTAASFAGDGASLTNLSASNIASGTLSDSRLSANVALLNAVSSTFSGSVSASSFSGDGSGLTSLNGSNVSSGTVGSAYLPATVVYSDAASTTFSGSISASSVSGDGNGLTNLNAANLTGALPALDGSSITNLNASNVSSGTLGDSYLSSNVAKYNDAAPTFDNTVSASGFSGSGASLTNLDGSSVSSGTVGAAYLPATVAYTDAASTTFVNGVSAASFSGSGASLTSLDASNLSSGTVADARLSGNVALYDAAAPTFTNTVTADAFSGGGSGLTSLNASNVSSGTLSDSRLSANVPLLNAATQTFTGDLEVSGAVSTSNGFYGSGVNVTDLNANELSTGTVPDARLSGNVPLKDAVTNAFTGNLSVGGNLNVVGDIVSGGAVNVVLSDNFLDLNGGNTAGAPIAGGLAVNVESFGTLFAGVVTEFAAGSAGVDPYLVLTGDASALVEGAFVQISGSADGKNDGQYTVYSAAYNTPAAGQTLVTVKGSATSAHTVASYTPFIHNQFVTGSSETATLTAIRISALAVSNGALYDSSAAAISTGVWAYGYGATEAAFNDGWVSLAPAAAQTLQQAYNASGTPASIELASGKDLTVAPAVGATAGFSFSGNTASSIQTVDGAELTIGDAAGNSDTSLVGITNLPSANRLRIGSPTAAGVAINDLCYVNSAGEAQKISTADQKFVVGPKAFDGKLSSIQGSVVGIASTDAVVGAAMYVSSVPGAVSVVVPTSGRVTFVGVCVSVLDPATCEVIFTPQYIADL